MAQKITLFVDVPINRASAQQQLPYQEWQIFEHGGHKTDVSLKNSKFITHKYEFIGTHSAVVYIEEKENKYRTDTLYEELFLGLFPSDDNFMFGEEFMGAEERRRGGWRDALPPSPAVSERVKRDALRALRRDPRAEYAEGRGFAPGSE